MRKEKDEEGEGGGEPGEGGELRRGVFTRAPTSSEWRVLQRPLPCARAVGCLLCGW